MHTISFAIFPIIETERLVLRQLRTDDSHDMFTLRTDEAVMKYVAKTRPKNEDEALQLIQKINQIIEKNEGINWGISLKTDAKLIGTIALFNFKHEHYRAELGYLLHPTFHRQGIMDEAIKAVLQFGFDKLNIHSIEAIVDPENAASISILEKNNFKREAYFREDCYFEGKFLDSAVYCLLASD